MTQNDNHSGIQQFWTAIQALQQEVIESQLDLLGQIAAVMTQTIADDGQIFLFGTGHSHMIAEEGHYRAGGLAPVIPILITSLMLHENAVLSGAVERTPGLAEPLLVNYNPRAGDMIFIFSNSGVNQLPVEMALAAKAKGLIVVSVSSLAYAQIAPLSSLGRRLDDVADFALDNHGRPGDSLITIEGVPWPTGPSSTIVGCLIWQCLVTETVSNLHKQGRPAPLYASANMAGAADHNQTLLETWRKRNPHL